ncbi:MAG: ethanolamine utilization protein EutN [Planctomycetaceae bacterium]|nr:MAG: ethanolamine utilization protein EutN [Planctomycetaceae bacterium]
MQLARVIGRATSTVKHPSMAGWRLLLTQPLTRSGQADGAPQLVLDHLGAGRGDLVIISSDGKAARELVGTEKTCVRWTIQGIVDRWPPA